MLPGGGRSRATRRLTRCRPFSPRTRARWRTSASQSPPSCGIVRRCLAKWPDDRFSSAHDLALVLEAESQNDEPFVHFVTVCAASAFHGGRGRDRARRPRDDLGPMGALASSRLGPRPATTAGRSARPPRARNRGPAWRSRSSRTAPGIRHSISWASRRRTGSLTDSPASPRPTSPSRRLMPSGAVPPTPRRVPRTPTRGRWQTSPAPLSSCRARGTRGRGVRLSARLSEPRSGRLLKSFEPERGPRARTSDVLQALTRRLWPRSPSTSTPTTTPGWIPAIARGAPRDCPGHGVLVSGLERGHSSPGARPGAGPTVCASRLQLAMARFSSGTTPRPAEHSMGWAPAKVGSRSMKSRRFGRFEPTSRDGRGIPGRRTRTDATCPWNVGRPLRRGGHALFRQSPCRGRGMLAPWSGKRHRWRLDHPEIRPHALHMAGRFDDQLAVASRARARYPTMLYFHEHQAAAQAAMGRSATSSGPSPTR